MKKLLPSFLTLSVFFCLFIIKNNYVLAASDNTTTHSINITTSEGKTECDPNLSASTAKSSCPADCNLCMDQVTTTSSCATTFNLYTKIEYSGKDEKIIKRDLNFVIDPSGANVPFVGKAGEEDENKYLADYFEGTNEYYANYGNQTTLTNYQGLLRKLTPSGYQDQLKKQLIARVPLTSEKGIPLEVDQIHNYQIQYVGRLCWDVPFWMDAGKFVLEKLGETVLNIIIEPINKGLNKIKDFFTNLFNIEQKGEEINIKAKVNLPDIGHYCLYASQDTSLIGRAFFSINELFSNLPGIGRLYDGLLAFSEKIPGLVHVSLSPTENGSLADFKQEGQEGRMPPDISEENYIEKLSAWKNLDNGKWYRLWQAVPMVTREVSIGEIRPYTGTNNPNNPNDSNNPDNLVDDVNTRLIKVPHLARLYETSKIINNLLIPPKTTTVEILPTTPKISENEVPTECIKENYLTGDGDKLCCQAISGKVTAEFENPLYEECHQGLDDLKAKCKALPAAAKVAIVSCNQEVAELENKCSETQTQEFSQAIGVKLSHPFLDEIWQNTTYPETGFFNIFRPAGVAPFEDIDAATNISYRSSSDVSPQEGLFFFPHLGGIQKAKEYVVNQALWPYEEKK
jgi:hypothetical protein